MFIILLELANKNLTYKKQMSMGSSRVPGLCNDLEDRLISLEKEFKKNTEDLKEKEKIWKEAVGEEKKATEKREEVEMIYQAEADKAAKLSTSYTQTLKKFIDEPCVRTKHLRTPLTGGKRTKKAQRKARRKTRR